MEALHLHTCVSGQGLQEVQVSLDIGGDLALVRVKLVEGLLGFRPLQLTRHHPEQIPQILHI